MSQTYFRWHGEEAKRRAYAALRRALYAAGEYVLETANRTVPHQEGVLEGSGDVSPHPTDLAVAISYDTPYARRQHEETTWRHDPPRRAKWLELTLEEEQAAVRAYLQRELKKAFKE